MRRRSGRDEEGVLGRHWGRRRWLVDPLHVLAPTATVLVMLAAAACGTISRPPATTTSSLRPTPTTADTLPPGLAALNPTPATERTAAIAGFVASQRAFDAAARAVNPNDPVLAATMVDPVLRVTRDFLITLAVNHDTVRGPATNLGHPVVVSYSPSRVVVRTCSPKPKFLTYLPNGQPVPGILGEDTNDVLTGVMVPGPQHWMLQSAADQVVSSCAGH